MKVNSIINRYLFREVLPPFFINVSFLLFVFLMTKILDITNYIVNYKDSIKTAVLNGINHIDTAINYRYQVSEEEIDAVINY